MREGVCVLGWSVGVGVGWCVVVCLVQVSLLPRCCLAVALVCFDCGVRLLQVLPSVVTVPAPAFAVAWIAHFLIWLLSLWWFHYCAVVVYCFPFSCLPSPFFGSPAVLLLFCISLFSLLSVALLY